MENLEQKSDSINVEWLDKMELNATKQAIDGVKIDEIQENENNIEWIDVNPTMNAEGMPMLDEELILEVGMLSASMHKTENIAINKIWKVWKKIYINQKFCIEPEYNSKNQIKNIWISQKIWWNYCPPFEDTSITQGNKWPDLYNKLNINYFS